VRIGRPYTSISTSISICIYIYTHLILNRDLYVHRLILRSRPWSAFLPGEELKKINKKNNRLWSAFLPVGKKIEKNVYIHRERERERERERRRRRRRRRHRHRHTHLGCRLGSSSMFVGLLLPLLFVCLYCTMSAICR